MFSNFLFMGRNELSESIKEKLKSPETTLEDLLIEDELLDGLKSENNDLVNFFNKEKIKKMLNYITKEQEDDQIKGYKFPFICSQIFELNIDKIMNYFFEQSKSQSKNDENKIELIDYLFNNFFPENESIKLNYVLCGYFSSLIKILLNKKPTNFLKYIYLERPNFLDKMVSHSYRKSISDSLCKLLNFESDIKNFSEEIKVEMKKQRKRIISNIFETINIDKDKEDLNSIYFFITSLFDESNIKEQEPLFEEIIKEERIIKSIINKPFHNLNLENIDSKNNNEKYIILLNKRKNFSTLIDIISFFLKNILKLNLKLPSNTEELKTPEDNPIILIGAELSKILKPLLQNNFIKKNENEELQIQSFNNYYLKPLGEYKIKIIDLLNDLIPYYKNIPKFFDDILIQVGFFKTAFEFLLQYEWNNFYQKSLLNLFKTLFNNADAHKDINKHLIEEIKIFDIIQAHTNLNNIEQFNFIPSRDNVLNEHEIPSVPIKRGYYSFFIGLSYKLNSVMGDNPADIQGISKRKGSFSFLKETNNKNEQDFFYKLFKGFEENNKKEEEKKFSYECMKEFMNNNWSEFYKLNIEDVIKQYEDNKWPKADEKPSSISEELSIDKETDLNTREENFDKSKDKVEILNPFYSGDDDQGDKNNANINNDLANDNKDNTNINKKKEGENGEKKKIIQEKNREEKEENNKEKEEKIKEKMEEKMEMNIEENKFNKEKNKNKNNELCRCC